MSAYEKIKFVRRPRPPKLEKIFLNRSLSDEESTEDFTDDTECANNLTCQSELSTNREIVSTSLYLNTNFDKQARPTSPKQAKIILPNLNNSESGKTLYIIEEGKTLTLTSANVYQTKMNVTENEFIQETEDSLKTKSLKKRSSKNVSPTKTAVSQTSNKSSTTEHSFILPLKMPGPDPMPCRPLKFHHDDIELKKSYYETYSYDNTDLQPYNYAEDFDLNNFLIDNTMRSRYIIDNSINKNFKLISSRNYTQICQLLNEKLAYINNNKHKRKVS